MKKFRFYNLTGGWLSFLIAAIVYLMTIEPTTSFWDCGEFIASAYKLEVGHPPGAPFFMLLGRFFSFFAGGNNELVARMINSLSALASAFTILFLFWTITHLARKIIIKSEADYTTGNLLAIFGSGLVGALAYTFSDTFWFSAAEGEVYATSSLFTAIVFWAILKWENIADKKYANRWLILIAYLMGLSIGVHLLNLLAIPAIVFVYYFKKYKVTRKGIWGAAIVAVILLGFIMYGIIPGIVKIGTLFELLFVNGFGLPFNSGLIVYFLLLLGALGWGIYYTHQKQKVLANTIILGITVIVIGYSTYATIIIRSIAEPPMDQNDPDDAFTLLSYLNREQYGDRPLVFGHYFNAPIENVEEGKPVYSKIEGRYEITNTRPEYEYDERFNTLFPRMYSSEARHVEAYNEWANIEGIPIKTTNNQGKPETIYKPTLGENLKFLFKYQIGFMYFRYFMWNFSGRQNDIQGHGEVTHGNWISGIGFIDEPRLGDQDRLPESLANNKARNKYYLLPLLLGLVGFVFQLQRHKKDFTIVTLLFVFTGLAIVFYLNQTPYQPRERDYAYAGSFYAFAIWIGLGVLGLYASVLKKLPSVPRAGLFTLVSLIFVPGLMARENWDDHDRSNRYAARDFAYNYLNSCAPDAIIFTNGDNDTFPLWYLQEVEEVRTDVRVINLSYLSADWYIQQMHRQAYDSDPVPFSLTLDKYRSGTRDIVYLIERVKTPVRLKDAIDFVASDDPKTKQMPNYRERIDYFPSKHFYIDIDSSQVLETGTVKEKNAGKIVDRLTWSINRNYVTKNDLMVMDLMATNNWERPVYFAITVARENYLNLEKYFQVEGLAYRVVPIEANNQGGSLGNIETDIMYENLMNKFKWGNIQDPDVYLDENILRMLSNFRNSFARLSEALIEEGKNDSARMVLDRSLEILPHERVPYNFFVVPIIENYYRINAMEKGNEIARKLGEIAVDELTYYLNIEDRFAGSVDYPRRLNLHIMQELIRITNNYNQQDLAKELEEQFQQLAVLYTPPAR